MASSRSEENVNLRHFPRQGGVTVLVRPAILLDSFDYCCLGRCFSLYFWHYDIVWEMLLPYCHVIATFCFCLADVVALLH